MSNTHRLEKLRLAEAPDGTRVWTKTPLPNAKWVLSYAVEWRQECKYVVADGFYEEERKHFAEHGEIQFLSKYVKDKLITVEGTCDWDPEYEYCITPPKPQWYEGVISMKLL